MNAPLIGLSRHRLTTDGLGVTTLVAFHGCPLRCRYCLNSQCLRADGVWRTVTPEELLAETIADNLYFLATGGGICFGGGEPLLRTDFIRDFCEQCPKEWRFYVETSLNVEQDLLEKAVPCVDHFYIDVKDMNPTIYKNYTGADNSRVVDNLQWLSRQQLADRVTIRLPLIPNHNTDADRQLSRRQLEAMGFSDFDCFDYVCRPQKTIV